MVMAVSVGILIGIGVGIVALFLAAILLPEVFFHKPDQDFATKDRVDARGTLRTSLVQAIGGAAVAGGLVFTAQTIAVSQQMVLVSQQTEIGDRFNKAAAELDDSHPDVQVAGILALERIASDSEEAHLAAIELIANYATENAVRVPFVEDCSPDRPPLSATMQAAAIAIGRRVRYQGGKDMESGIHKGGRDLEKEEQLFLVGVNFHDARLGNADLRYATLYRAHLECADLRNAQLQYADPIGAHLYGAMLKGAHLENTNLNGADLEHADLQSAQMSCAQLMRSGPARADLRRADLHGAKLTQADLSGAIMSGLERARLNGTDFADAILDGADLTNTDLSGAINLTRHQLEKANTAGAVLPANLPPGGGDSPALNCANRSPAS